MTINKIVTQTGTWIATILLARILVPADYGLVGMAGLLVGIISLVGDFGLSVSLIQKKEVSEDEICALFWQYLIIGCVLATLIYFLAPLAVMFWDEPEVLGLVRLSAIPFFFNALCEIPTGLMKRKMRFKQFGLLSSFAALSGSVVSIFFALQGAGAYSLVYGTIAISLVKCGLVYLWEPFRPHFIFRTKESASHLRFGAIVTVERYLWWIYSNADFWLASKFLGKELYGVYSMAIYMASAPMEKLLSVINPVVYPTFSKIDNREELIKFFYELVKKTAYFIFPIFTLLFWVADDLLPTLLGNKWQGVVPVFQVIVLLSSLRLVGGFHSPLLNALGRPEVSLKNTTIGAVLGVTAFSLGVSHGIQGLLVAWLVFYPIFFCVSLIRVANTVGFTVAVYCSNLKKPVYFCAIMSLAIGVTNILLRSYSPLIEQSSLAATLRILIDITVALITYLLLFYHFDRPLFAWYKGVITRKKSLMDTR